MRVYSTILGSPQMRRWLRRLIAMLLALAYAAFAIFVLQLTQSQPNWGITLDPQGPQKVCGTNSPCLETWHITDEQIGQAGFGYIPLSARICAIEDQHGHTTLLSNDTTSDEIDHSLGLGVLSSNQTCDLTNITSFPVAPVAVIIDLITILVSATLAVVIFLHSTQRRLASLAVAFLSALIVAFGFVPLEGVGTSLELTIDAISGSILAPAFLAMLVWQLLLVRRKPSIRVPVFILIGLGAILSSGLLAMITYLNQVSLYPFISSIEYIYTLICLLIVLGITIVSNVRSTKQPERDYARVFGLSTAIAVLPLLVLTVIPSLINYPQSVDGTISASSIVAIPLALTYVVLRRDLLKVDSLVRRTAEAGIWLLFLAAACGLVTFIAQQVLNLTENEATIIFVVLLIAGFFGPVVRGAANFVAETGFFPEVRRYRRQVEAASLRPRIAEEQVIATELLADIHNALPIRQAAVLSRADTSFVHLAGTSTDAVAADHPVVAEMQLNGNPVLALDTPSLMTMAPAQVPEGERQPWESAIPIMLNDRLLAIVLVGPREDGLGLSTVDRDLIFQLANRRAISFDYGRILADLRNSLEEQRRIDRLKDQFIMTAHHELRTPLTGLLGYVEIVKMLGPQQWQDRPEEVARYLDEAVRNGDELVQLLETLLAADRTSVRPLALQSTRLDVAILLESLLTNLRVAHGVDAQRITLTCEPGLTAWMDVQAFTQVIQNLLTNAMKYSPAGTPILLEARHRLADDEAEFIVRDYGQGIDPSQQSVIFEKFTRLERDLNSQVRGTGLGLSIVRDRVLASGGNVWVESTGIPGEGSTFHVTVPAHEPDYQPETDLATTKPRLAISQRIVSAEN